MAKIGDAFLIETPPNGHHLYIIIFQLKNGNFLLVNITSSAYDQSCAIEPDPQCSFIKHKSFVNYKDTLELSDSIISNKLSVGEIIHKCFFPTQQIKKMQAGGKISPRLKNKYKIELP